MRLIKYTLDFNSETNDFDQQMACGAPVCWSKYITYKAHLVNKCKLLLYPLVTNLNLFVPLAIKLRFLPF